MVGYLVARVIKMIVTIFVIMTAVFFATRLSGDAIDFLAPEGLDQVSRQAMIGYFGLDRPLLDQYVLFLRGFVDGEFGISLIERRPVAVMFLERVWPSLQLIILAIAATILIGIPAGIAAALARRSAIGTAIMTVAFLGYAIPNFVLAILLVLVFSFWLGWLPSSGNGTAAHFVMPVITLAAFYIAGLTRFTRNAMLDVMSQDFLRTARAKGLPERIVIVRHAVRNALITVLTVLGLQLAVMIAAGSVVVETVFAWRGIGDLLVNAALRRDYPVLQFGVLAVACGVVIVNTLVDLAYGIADPRVRLRGA
jgi:ABC-type dipeptide/oligopeptide/nickel transport system permease component